MLAASFTLAALPAAAGPVSWAHQAAGAVQSNGAVMVKSLSGGTYAGTQNPSGAVAKANQNAATQPPTVIVQATASAGVNLAATRSRYTGNLGGIAGADAICVGEFGTGWHFADQADIAGAINTPTTINAWFFLVYSAAFSCQGYTSSDPSLNGHYPSGSSGVMGYNTMACNAQFAVLCARR